MLTSLYCLLKLLARSDHPVPRHKCLKDSVPDWEIDLCIVFGNGCDMTLVLLTGGDRTLEAEKGRSLSSCSLI